MMYLPDEGFSRNSSYALNLISTFLLWRLFILQLFIWVITFYLGNKFVDFLH